MARIIVKNGYLKGGSEKTAAHLNNLVKYIATRDGVEKIKSGHELWHSTQKQQTLIGEILREFPDAKEMFEYEDYLANPNRENASEFITIALEQHLDKIGDREKYLDYIANRPRVEKFDSHGLFTAGDAPLVLSQVAEEVATHTGNVWTPIISLRREDAARLGYDSARAWKALLSAKAMELAENLKIHPDHLKWYAAFHNESHHPHIHMICYSTDPREGYLTKQGIRKMKSSLANEIFRQELIPLYGEKTQRRDELKEQAAEAMGELIHQMKGGVLVSGRMEQLLTYLAERLQTVSEKKQYGYLKADLKNVVDEIVDELAKDSRIAEAYRLWWEVRGRIEAVYTETPFDPPPLSRCEDFKPIRNMVIQEALNLGNITGDLSQELTSNSILFPFLHETPDVALEISLALLPIILIFIIFQKVSFKLSNRAVRKILFGILFTFLGLVLFLVGVNAGFMAVGSTVGYNIALLNNKAYVIIVGFILGVVTILAEPAVYVLTHQIEDVTSGYVSRKVVMVTLSIGVGIAVALSIVRILIPDLQLWQYLLPGYMISIALMYFVPKLFVGIAFDSGGVASGPMTATFILAYAQGAAEATKGASVLVDGFGIISMVAMTPLIALQLLGLVYKVKTKKEV
ncbi:MAG: MobP3 family relaxase [bacterium]